MQGRAARVHGVGEAGRRRLQRARVRMQRRSPMSDEEISARPGSRRVPYGDAFRTVQRGTQAGDLVL